MHLHILIFLVYNDNVWTHSHAPYTNPSLTSPRHCADTMLCVEIDQLFVDELLKMWLDDIYVYNVLLSKCVTSPFGVVPFRSNFSLLTHSLPLNGLRLVFSDSRKGCMLGIQKTIPHWGVIWEGRIQHAYASYVEYACMHVKVFVYCVDVFKAYTYIILSLTIAINLNIFMIIIYIAPSEMQIVKITFSSI